MPTDIARTVRVLASTSGPAVSLCNEEGGYLIRPSSDHNNFLNDLDKYTIDEIYRPDSGIRKGYDRDELRDVFARELRHLKEKVAAAKYPDGRRLFSHDDIFITLPVDLAEEIGLQNGKYTGNNLLDLLNG